MNLNRYRSRVPELDEDGVRVERFTVGERDIANLRAALRDGRGTRPGTYTRLVVDGVLWMSDTDAEVWDHHEVVRRCRQEWVKRVLLNGLGLGMVLQAVLENEHVERVDVVEKDPRIVRLIGRHFADPRVTFHEADAYTVGWPPNTRWDVAWHDVWPSLCTDDLADHARLLRRYGNRTGWQGAWGHADLVAQRRRDRSVRW